MDHVPKYQMETMKLLQENINGTFGNTGVGSGVSGWTSKPQATKVK